MIKINYISWDWLENSYVANDGTMYRNIDDIPEDLKKFVRDVKHDMKRYQIYRKINTESTEHYLHSS